MSTYSFTASQSIGTLSYVTFTDTSTSPAGGLTSRRISIRLANGNWLDTNGESSTIVYITWPIADSTLTVSILTQNTACDITVEWMTGSTATGTATNPTAFVEYDYVFSYDLIGDQTAAPGTIQDTNYYSNFSQFIVNLFCSEQAVETGSDIYSSQEFMNMNLFMQQNENDFF